jgi:adenylate kinase family enzyme
LRAESKKDTEDGKLIASIMSEGKLVPVKISCGLLKKAMDEQGNVNIFKFEIFSQMCSLSMVFREILII